MTVSRLAENRLLITLTEPDVDTLFTENEGEYRNADKRLLTYIAGLACIKTGIYPAGRRILIEALPMGEGCCLLLTLEEKKRERRYVLKKGSSICCLLGNSTELLDAIERLYRLNICCTRNSVYEKDGSYYLILDYPAIPRKLRRALSEYTKSRGGAIASARIKETGRAVCQRNAIATIGRWL